MTAKLELLRYCYSDDFVQGKLIVHMDNLASRQFWTIERAWAANQPGISCIPDGNYFVKDWTRPNGDRCLMVTGPGLGDGPSDLDISQGITRWGILFHSANRADQLAGCIAPGKRQKPGQVLASRDAVSAIRGLLRQHWPPSGLIPLEIKPVTGTG